MKKRLLIIICAIVCVFVAVLSVIFYTRYKKQSNQIKNLNIIVDRLEKNLNEAENSVSELKYSLNVAESCISELENSLDSTRNDVLDLENGLVTAEKDILDIKSDIVYLGAEKEYLEEGYNYLAIGNSITIHGKADYWWDERGMAASEKEKDYVHLIADYLKNQFGDVCFYATNFFTWEIQSYDRAETLKEIYPYLNDKLDLVTIQLGENVTEFSTYENDYITLINYIKGEAPQAQILVIDEFWEDDYKTTFKKNACEITGVDFVSLEDIKGNDEYMCGLGTTVYDSDGNTHIVKHKGVAIHPNDAGMKIIAERVISFIK